MSATDPDTFGKRAATLSLMCQEAGSTPITAGCVASICLLCLEASSGYPAEVVDGGGQFGLDGIQTEVDGQGDGRNGGDRDGEKRLTGKLHALQVQHGAGHASDNVSGAWLDPV